MYKFINRETLQYRKGVNAFIIDFENNFLLVQKNIFDLNQWEVPGGGVEEDENFEVALSRELEEELGSKYFEIVCKSSVINKYEWPEEIIQQHFDTRGKWYRGQEKFQYLVRFTGNKYDLKKQDAELREIKWIPYKELEKHMVFKNQWEIAKKTLDSFIDQGCLKV